MNYFLDIPTFSRFYAPKDKEDEKPPPDLKSTEARIEERKIKTGRRRRQTPETKERRPPPADEAMGSVFSRKEKSSWPDWQFWKRGEGSTGPFGAFRKSTGKATGAFTFRKDIDDTAVRTNQPGLAENEHGAPSSDSVSVNAGVNNYGKEEGIRCPPIGESEPDEDDPLVSYKKEINGAKHVVINMEKIEARRKNGKYTPKPAAGELVPTSSAPRVKADEPSSTWKGRAEKNLPEKLGTAADTSTSVRNTHVSAARPFGELGAAKVIDKTGRKPAEEVDERRNGVVSNGFVQFRAEFPKVGPKSDCSRKIPPGQSVPQQSANTRTTNAPQKQPQNATKYAGVHDGIQKPAPRRSATTLQPEPSKPTQDSDEKPCGKQNPNPGDPSNSSVKTIKNSVIPLPRLNAKEVARTKLAAAVSAKATPTDAKGACLEKGKLHNVLKKVTENWRPAAGNGESGSSSPAQNSPAPIPVQAKVRRKGGRKGPGSAKAARKRPEIRPVPPASPKPENNATKKLAAPAGNEKRTGHAGAKALERLLNGCDNASKAANRAAKREAATPPVVTKDASTATPMPRAKVDAEVQVPCEEDALDASDVLISVADETESLLRKRPWDTERVLKMQVLLDERQVELEQLKEDGRRQGEELKATTERCEELEEVVIQASMEGKPQLIVQINELAEMKNELLLEVSRLTVDIEKERTNVKTLRTELVEVKGQLSAARKKNAGCQ